MSFRLLLFAATCGWSLSSIALGQSQPTCPKGFQPYANRCISQRMADYISCVEASGGNSERIATEVTNANAGNTGVNVQGSGSGVVMKGSGSVTVDRATEHALATKFEQTWTSRGMEECRKVLDPPIRSQPKTQSSLRPSTEVHTERAASCCDWIVGRWRATVERISNRDLQNVPGYTDHCEWNWEEAYVLDVSSSPKMVGHLAGSLNGKSEYCYSEDDDSHVRIEERTLPYDEKVNSEIDISISPSEVPPELKVLLANCKSDACAWVAKSSSPTEFVVQCLTFCNMSLWGPALGTQESPVQRIRFVKE